MSHPVHERLRELEGELRDLQALPAAAVRARGRRRARRQRVAVWTAAGVIVAATAGITYAWPRPQAPPAGDLPRVRCVLALPQGPAEVRIRLLDGGAPAALLDETAAQLRARSFAVLDGAPGRDPVGATALRYGPAAIGDATLLRAELSGEVAVRFDPGRRDKIIDLTVGPAFTRLATATEVNEYLVARGEPSAPPQCR